MFPFPLLPPNRLLQLPSFHRILHITFIRHLFLLLNRQQGIIPDLRHRIPERIRILCLQESLFPAILLKLLVIVSFEQ